MLLKVVNGDLGDLRRRFGAAVRKRRLEIGLSQEILAQQSGLHRTYISDIERGERNVSLDNIGRIARSLGVSISALFAQTETPDDF